MMAPATLAKKLTSANRSVSPISSVPRSRSKKFPARSALSPKSTLPGADTLLSNIKETFKIRQHLLRARNRLDNHLGAIYGWDENERAPEALDGWEKIVTGALQEQSEALDARCQEYEKNLRKLARELPVYPWVENFRGLSDLGLGLGLIIGAGMTEHGCIFDVANPAKVWKRFGLGLVNGERQRRVANDADLAIEHGYDPARRALLHVVGENLIRAKSPLASVYAERKALELTKLEDKPGVKMHAHRRALRYIEKRLLLELWREWQRTVRAAGLTEALPAIQ
jgi:hypothetical protein